MKRLNCGVACIGVILVLAAAFPVEATICAADAVPASTLVFPFVVLNYPGGNESRSTIIGITNTGYEGQIVHLTFWTDYGEAFLDFNIVVVVGAVSVILINVRL